jgi:hypothetical protein
MRTLTALALLCCSPVAFASGFVDDGSDDFGLSVSPEDPAAFVAGKLGLLSETLWPRWRGVAFRVLSGPPIDQVTAKALATGSGGTDDAPLKGWLDARAKTGLPVVIKAPNASYGYDYGNCYADAFLVATNTLRDRIRRFGDKSKEVAEWTQGQDAVFGNCEGDGSALITPAERVPAGIAPAIQQDRDYQLAASLFYARRFPDARTAFEKVAADAKSPWAGYARFAVARAMIRQAVNGDKPDLAQLAQAEQKLAAVLADKNAAALHASARRLVRFIAFRARPDEQLPALGDLLAKSGGDDFDLVLTDFAWLADKQPQPLPVAALDKFGKSELTEWTLAWQLAPADRTVRAVARYHEKKSVPWLLLALASVEPEHAEAKSLLEDARQFKPGSPGYPTAIYHRARLLVGQKRIPAARALIDEALARGDLDRQTVNLLDDTRYGIARTVQEAIGFMTRQGRSGNPHLSPAAETVFLQYLPIIESVQAAKDARLPAVTRTQILHAAWLRAALLGDLSTARSIVAALLPQEKDELKEWSAASSDDERRYALVRFWLSKGWDLSLGYGCSVSPALEASNGPPPPPFVDAATQTRAREEAKRLTAMGLANPAIFRADTVVAWAKSHKTDSRVPDDLSDAVNGTRRACGGADATAASKRAWKVLHNQFPKSDAAHRTKYWY